MASCGWDKALSPLISCRMSSKRENWGADRASHSPCSSSRRDNASATTFMALGLYSTTKSNPSNLLAHWCCGIVETLVEEEAKTPVIRAHHETAPPQVRAPMPNRLDEPDQLALVGSELGVTRRDGPAEERDRPSALMKHGAKA